MILRGAGGLQQYLLPPPFAGHRLTFFPSGEVGTEDSRSARRSVGADGTQEDRRLTPPLAEVCILAVRAVVR